MPLGEEEQSNG